ncbi:MAG: hypothetical protein Q3979_10120, partial [Actinomycetaceae bacterium]|nr:hypothetical protein [Actinomycetaceae bacterium]
MLARGLPEPLLVVVLVLGAGPAELAAGGPAVPCVTDGACEGSVVGFCAEGSVVVGSADGSVV